MPLRQEEIAGACSHRMVAAPQSMSSPPTASHQRTGPIVISSYGDNRRGRGTVVRRCANRPHGMADFPVFIAWQVAAGTHGAHDSDRPGRRMNAVRGSAFQRHVAGPGGRGGVAASGHDPYPPCHGWKVAGNGLSATASHISCSMTGHLLPASTSRRHTFYRIPYIRKDGDAGSQARLSG